METLKHIGTGIIFTPATLDGLAGGESEPKAASAAATHSANAPATLSAAAPATVGFDQSRLALVNSAMHRMVDAGESAGVMTMLVRHGKIVNYDAYGKDSIAKGTPLKRDHIFRLFSQTKPVTGIAMMILYEQGKWQLNDPVSKYIPEFANLKVFAGLDKDGKPVLEEPRQPPTMAMLMTHTAGFGYGLENVNYVDYVDQQFQKQGVLRSNSLHEAGTKIGNSCVPGPQPYIAAHTTDFYFGVTGTHAIKKTKTKDQVLLLAE